MSDSSDIRAFLSQAAAGYALARPQARAAFQAVLTGAATPAQIAALLTALAVRGETIAEITGAAEAMRAAVTPIQPGLTGRALVDTCGTGGDGAGTFNISTAAAIVAAAAGVAVAKHGNRSVTGKTGSADVLAELGVHIEAAPAVVERCLRECGIGFLFAPTLHTAMKHAGPVRRELGFRTVFNLLGPLTNPAGADRQVIGVPKPELTETLAAVLAELGTVRAMVVHAADGLDEISNSVPTRITELTRGQIRTTQLRPATLGIAAAEAAALRVGSPAESATAIRAVLAGERGPRRDVVLLNAAAALLVAEAAPDWPPALARAARAIDDGSAAALLARWAELSRAG